jgi:hypothetical protein
VRVGLRALGNILQSSAYEMGLSDSGLLAPDACIWAASSIIISAFSHHLVAFGREAASRDGGL